MALDMSCRTLPISSMDAQNLMKGMAVELQGNGAEWIKSGSSGFSDKDIAECHQEDIYCPIMNEDMNNGAHLSLLQKAAVGDHKDGGSSQEESREKLCAAELEISGESMEKPSDHLSSEELVEVSVVAMEMETGGETLEKLPVNTFSPRVARAVNSHSRRSWGSGDVEMARDSHEKMSAGGEAGGSLQEGWAIVASPDDKMDSLPAAFQTPVSPISTCREVFTTNTSLQEKEGLEGGTGDLGEKGTGVPTDLLPCELPRCPSLGSPRSAYNVPGGSPRYLPRIGSLYQVEELPALCRRSSGSNGDALLEACETLAVEEMSAWSLEVAPCDELPMPVRWIRHPQAAMWKPAPSPPSCTPPVSSPAEADAEADDDEPQSPVGGSRCLAAAAAATGGSPSSRSPDLGSGLAGGGPHMKKVVEEPEGFEENGADSAATSDGDAPPTSNLGAVTASELPGGSSKGAQEVGGAAAAEEKRERKPSAKARARANGKKLPAKGGKLAGGKSVGGEEVLKQRAAAAAGRQQPLQRALVPGALPAVWAAQEVEAFTLALWLFGKEFRTLQSFVGGSKSVADVMHFYYGPFYGSPAWARWDASKPKRPSARKYARESAMVTGWRQKELLRRLSSSMPQHDWPKLTQVTARFNAGDLPLRAFVAALSDMVGQRVLLETFSVGAGKGDLTSANGDPGRGHNPSIAPPEIPVGEACRNLSTAEVICFLTGGHRISKTKAHDLFWQAVWPRLSLRGWHIPGQGRRSRGGGGDAALARGAGGGAPKRRAAAAAAEEGGGGSRRGGAAGREGLGYGGGGWGGGSAAAAAAVAAAAAAAAAAEAGAGQSSAKYVFLPPGAREVTRGALKGADYFDSLSTVLDYVAKNPGSLDASLGAAEEPALGQTRAPSRGGARRGDGVGEPRVLSARERERERVREAALEEAGVRAGAAGEEPQGRDRWHEGSREARKDGARARGRRRKQSRQVEVVVGGDDGALGRPLGQRREQGAGGRGTGCSEEEEEGGEEMVEVTVTEGPSQAQRQSRGGATVALPADAGVPAGADEGELIIVQVQVQVQIQVQVQVEVEVQLEEEARQLLEREEQQRRILREQQQQEPQLLQGLLMPLQERQGSGPLAADARVVCVPVRPAAELGGSRWLPPCPAAAAPPAARGGAPEGEKNGALVPIMYLRGSSTKAGRGGRELGGSGSGSGGGGGSIVVVRRSRALQLQRQRQRQREARRALALAVVELKGGRRRGGGREVDEEDARSCLEEQEQEQREQEQEEEEEEDERLLPPGKRVRVATTAVVAAVAAAAAAPLGVRWPRTAASLGGRASRSNSQQRLTRSAIGLNSTGGGALSFSSSLQDNACCALGRRAPEREEAARAASLSSSGLGRRERPLGAPRGAAAAARASPPPPAAGAAVGGAGVEPLLLLEEKRQVAVKKVPSGRGRGRPPKSLLSEERQRLERQRYSAQQEEEAAAAAAVAAAASAAEASAARRESGGEKNEKEEVEEEAAAAAAVESQMSGFNTLLLVALSAGPPDGRPQRQQQREGGNERGVELPHGRRADVAVADERTCDSVAESRAPSSGSGEHEGARLVARAPAVAAAAAAAGAGVYVAAAHGEQPLTMNTSAAACGASRKRSARGDTAALGREEATDGHEREEGQKKEEEERRGKVTASVSSEEQEKGEGVVLAKTLKRPRSPLNLSSLKKKQSVHSPVCPHLPPPGRAREDNEATGAAGGAPNRGRVEESVLPEPPVLLSGQATERQVAKLQGEEERMPAGHSAGAGDTSLLEGGDDKERGLLVKADVSPPEDVVTDGLIAGRASPVRDGAACTLVPPHVTLQALAKEPQAGATAAAPAPAPAPVQADVEGTAEAEAGAGFEGEGEREGEVEGEAEEEVAREVPAVAGAQAAAATAAAAAAGGGGGPEKQTLVTAEDQQVAPAGHAGLPPRVDQGEDEGDVVPEAPSAPAPGGEERALDGELPPVGGDSSFDALPLTTSVAEAAPPGGGGNGGLSAGERRVEEGTQTQLLLLGSHADAPPEAPLAVPPLSAAGRKLQEDVEGELQQEKAEQAVQQQLHLQQEQEQEPEREEEQEQGHEQEQEQEAEEKEEEGEKATVLADFSDAAAAGPGQEDKQPVTECQVAREEVLAGDNVAAARSAAHKATSGARETEVGAPGSGDVTDDQVARKGSPGTGEEVAAAAAQEVTPGSQEEEEEDVVVPPSREAASPAAAGDLEARGGAADSAGADAVALGAPPREAAAAVAAAAAAAEQEAAGAAAATAAQGARAAVTVGGRRGAVVALCAQVRLPPLPAEATGSPQPEEELEESEEPDLVQYSRKRRRAPKEGCRAQQPPLPPTPTMTTTATAGGPAPRPASPKPCTPLSSIREGFGRLMVPPMREYTVDDSVLVLALDAGTWAPRFLPGSRARAPRTSTSALGRVGGGRRTTATAAAATAAAAEVAAFQESLMTAAKAGGAQMSPRAGPTRGQQLSNGGGAKYRAPWEAAGDAGMPRGEPGSAAGAAVPSSHPKRKRLRRDNSRAAASEAGALPGGNSELHSVGQRGPLLSLGSPRSPALLPAGGEGDAGAAGVESAGHHGGRGGARLETSDSQRSAKAARTSIRYSGSGGGGGGGAAEPLGPASTLLFRKSSLLLPATTTTTTTTAHHTAGALAAVGVGAGAGLGASAAAAAGSKHAAPQPRSESQQQRGSHGLADMSTYGKVAGGAAQAGNGFEFTEEGEEQGHEGQGLGHGGALLRKERVRERGDAQARQKKRVAAAVKLLTQHSHRPPAQQHQHRSGGSSRGGALAAAMAVAAAEGGKGSGSATLAERLKAKRLKAAARQRRSRALGGVRGRGQIANGPGPGPGPNQEEKRAGQEQHGMQQEGQRKRLPSWGGGTEGGREEKSGGSATAAAAMAMTSKQRVVSALKQTAKRRSELALLPGQPPRKRGRPVGSKNKKKAGVAAAAAAPPAAAAAAQPKGERDDGRDGGDGAHWEQHEQQEADEEEEEREEEGPLALGEVGACGAHGVSSFSGGGGLAMHPGLGSAIVKGKRGKKDKGKASGGSVGAGGRDAAAAALVEEEEHLYGGLCPAYRPPRQARRQARLPETWTSLLGQWDPAQQDCDYELYGPGWLFPPKANQRAGGSSQSAAVAPPPPGVPQGPKLGLQQRCGGGSGGGATALMQRPRSLTSVLQVCARQPRMQFSTVAEFGGGGGGSGGGGGGGGAGGLGVGGRRAFFGDHPAANRVAQRPAQRAFNERHVARFSFLSQSEGQQGKVGTVPAGRAQGRPRGFRKV